MKNRTFYSRTLLSLAMTLSGFLLIAMTSLLLDAGDHKWLFTALGASLAIAGGTVSHLTNLTLKRSVDSRQVFIIHDMRDRKRVEELAQFLRSGGFDPWLAEERIQAGSDWRVAIEKAQSNSPATLVLVTDNFDVKSPSVAKELRLALESGFTRDPSTSPVIPVVVGSAQIPGELFTSQAARLESPEDRVELLNALRRVYGVREPT